MFAKLILLSQLTWDPDQIGLISRHLQLFNWGLWLIYTRSEHSYWDVTLDRTAFRSVEDEWASLWDILCQALNYERQSRWLPDSLRRGTGTLKSSVKCMEVSLLSATIHSIHGLWNGEISVVGRIWTLKTAEHPFILSYLPSSYENWVEKAASPVEHCSLSNNSKAGKMPMNRCNSGKTNSTGWV